MHAGYPEARPERDDRARLSYPAGEYETFYFTIPAGTAFVEACRFSFQPDTISVSTSAVNAEVRFRDIGGAPTTFYRPENANHNAAPFPGRRIVEARDNAGAGGQVLLIMGRRKTPAGQPAQ
jgi:hypothetical protein